VKVETAPGETRFLLSSSILSFKSSSSDPSPLATEETETSNSSSTLSSSSNSERNQNGAGASSCGSSAVTSSASSREGGAVGAGAGAGAGEVSAAEVATAVRDMLAAAGIPLGAERGSCCRSCWPPRSSSRLLTWRCWRNRCVVCSTVRCDFSTVLFSTVCLLCDLLPLASAPPSLFINLDSIVQLARAGFCTLMSSSYFFFPLFLLFTVFFFLFCACSAGWRRLRRKLSQVKANWTCRRICLTNEVDVHVCSVRARALPGVHRLPEAVPLLQEPRAEHSSSVPPSMWPINAPAAKRCIVWRLQGHMPWTVHN